MAAVHRALFWQKQQILYKFTNAHDFPSPFDPDHEFREACARWEAHCGMSFTKTDGVADLELSWAALGKNESGVLIGGDTQAWTTPRRIRFSTDANFVSVIQPNLGGAGVGLAGVARSAER
jgi:hypothetical protein